MAEPRLKEYLRPFYLKWFYLPLHPAARPQAWSDCWRYPRVPLGAPEIPGARDGLPDVLFLPMTDWHARIQRPHHLARELAAKGYRVFYLNMHLGREFPQPAVLDGGPRVCRLAERVWEIHIGLPREPVYHHRLLTGGETGKVVEGLNQVARAFGVRRMATVCQFPLWTEVGVEMGLTYGGPMIYDCHDLLEGFSRIAPEIISAEKQLYVQADVVVFSAKPLLEKVLGRVPSLESKARLIRNGVDVTHFRMSPRSKRKVAGYAGSLDEWFDVDAVAAAAERLPGCDFVFLGRVEDRRVLRLERYPNVRFHGEVPYDRLPAHMAEFDAGLIPFLINPLTLATNPIKLYEYFSCGLPVVTSRLPEVELYQDLVYIAGTPDEFAAQVEKAIAESDDELSVARRHVAEQESWTERASQLAKALAESP